MLRDKLKNSIKIVPVDVQDWQETVHIKSFTLKERLEFTDYIEAVKGKPGEKSINLELVLRSVCDSHGNLEFSEKDRDLLLQSSASAIDQIALEVLKINGLTQDTKKN